MDKRKASGQPDGEAGSQDAGYLTIFCIRGQAPGGVPRTVHANPRKVAVEYKVGDACTGYPAAKRGDLIGMRFSLHVPCCSGRLCVCCHSTACNVHALKAVSRQPDAKPLDPKSARSCRRFRSEIRLGWRMAAGMQACGRFSRALACLWMRATTREQAPRTSHTSHSCARYLQSCTPARQNLPCWQRCRAMPE